VDLLTESLSDNNYKVSQTSLQCLAHIVKTESSTLKPYANAIVPLVVRPRRLASSCRYNDIVHLICDTYFTRYARKHCRPGCMCLRASRFLVPR